MQEREYLLYFCLYALAFTDCPQTSRFVQVLCFKEWAYKSV